MIGIGAIGGQVSLHLARMGTPKIQLIDYDLVKRTNVTPQTYLVADIGQPKVDAIAAAIQQIEPTVDLALINAKRCWIPGIQPSAQ